MMATRLAFELRDEGNNIIPMEEAVEGRHAEIYQYDFSVDIPVDKGTGKVTGIREYSPLKITKPIDKSSPVIFQKLTEGTKLKSATISFYRHDPKTGAETLFYTVKFEDLTVISQTQSVLNTQSEKGRFMPPVEEISMMAERVTKTIQDGHIEYTDEYRKKGHKTAAGSAAAAA